MIRHWNTETGDLVTGGQDIFLNGRASTGAGIYHRLRMFFGEYFLDITDGTPWFQSVLGKKSQEVAEQAIKRAIITAPGVVALTSFQFTSDRLTRTINIDARVLDVNNDIVRILMGGDILERPDPTPAPPAPPADKFIVNLNQFTLLVE